MSQTNSDHNTAVLSTLPGDDVRQIMWRFADRYDLQMVVQSTRSVARGLVAKLVADGARNSHEWNEQKAEMLKAFDESGVTAVFMDPEDGGFIAGPKNMALALVAFELSWVDAGAATCSLAGNLALAPIHEKGTDEQKHTYMSRCLPAQPGENRKPWRGAFALTEPLPYVGVDTGVVSGKVRVAEWKEGKEPVLQVDKRGRFITNMGFANFVTAVVDTADERIKSSCMIILEEGDPGIYDRGSATLKLVHQLSSTCDPILSLKVPANRIIGGYTIKDGVIIPNFSHGEVIEAVFRRTRVTVALMSSAKLLSAIEPVIRYQRGRFRGGDSGAPGTPRYDLGLQQKEDAVHRLTDVWASGEASASLGFAAARLFDALDEVEKRKNQIFEEQGIKGARAQMKALKVPQQGALEYIKLLYQGGKRDQKRFEELGKDTLVQFLVTDSLANVLCPACKLWNTGHGADMMREAVSLMGGYGITEDCPGFLGQKWMDTQLEATYEGPEAVQRRQLSVTMTNELFLEQYREWIKEMRQLAAENTCIGAGTLAVAMELWLWTLEHLSTAKDENGKVLYHGQRHGVCFPLADALCWLLAVRYQMLDTLELKAKGPANPVLTEALPGFVNFFSDLCAVQAARAAGEAGKICAELVYGYHRLPEGSGTCACSLKAGSGVSFDGKETFVHLRNRLDECLAGARLAKDRAANAVTQVMIPEALDYPV
ncbi:MAG: acyl-CoA/acyl-ACP dehydrogenase [Candidatus Omnitrophica bacterium]|nr:acyl-CoA/acyl-ACP dehydrogenase [Candidatus Omnitrophota bacterium]MDD5671648.1 acyl-CoA/acyl-ACP dehydrogenase [Candidatus Omnitrophota bacterium]